jgi:hypothetical protein
MFADPPMTPEQRKAELQDLRHEPLLAQLRDDIRTEVAKNLAKFRAREAEFSEIDNGVLLSIYLNWKYRHVHAHPRAIVYSVELSERMQTDEALYAPVKSEFAELTKMIAAGEDLLGHKLLSPAIVRKPYELKPDYSRLTREDHLDLLLNEQGIHHLHLPGLQRKKGTPIVFAIFEPACAFFLDLARHDDYQTDRLARISYANWPGQHFRKIMADGLTDGKGNEIDLKDQQRTFIRNGAINCPIKVTDGLYVTPNAGGVIANGFAHAVVSLSDWIWNSLSLFVIRRYRAGFEEYFLEATGKPLPTDPVFHFRMRDSKVDWVYLIVEEQTGSVFSLPNKFGVAR